ncbi:MAG: ribonuclease H-like domain-containing protein, partial [Chloroflexota bacterium]
ETKKGGCFVVDYVYPFSHEYGICQIGDLLNVDLDRFKLGKHQNFKAYSPRDLLFLDIETRGLMETGSEVIQIGLAYFEKDAFVVRCLFARDLNEEGAMLADLESLLERYPLLVTFNGKSFDLRFLDGRAIMNRMFFDKGDLVEQPHIDLLPFARRVWRHLPSVALSQLDKHVLEVKRPIDEIPGWRIPIIYNHYLLDRNPYPIKGIFEHNRFDMLAMVGLMVEIDRLFEKGADLADPHLLLNLALHWEREGASPNAELLFNALINNEAFPGDIRFAAFRSLSLIYKRANRRSEAIRLWQSMADLSVNDIFPHIELAKHYEWHSSNPDRIKEASTWAAYAYQLAITHQPFNIQLHREIEHRLTRLASKER